MPRWRAVLYPIPLFFAYLAGFVLLFFRVVFCRKSFINGDIYSFYHPMWHTTIESIKHGVIPFWNPLDSFGAPFFANIQTCVFYPLTLFLYLPDFTWSLNFYILVHLAMTGCFTALWLRDIGEGMPCAWLSGIAYSLSGYMMCAIGGVIVLCSIAYFPLMLLVFRRAFREERSYSWRTAAALTATLQFLAGDPAVSFATFLILFLFSIFLGLRRLGRKEGQVFRPIGRLSQIALFFLGLTAFIWPLFMQYILHSDRAHTPDSEKLMYSMPWHGLGELFIPFLSRLDVFFSEVWPRQAWLPNSYSGITVLSLAIIALAWLKDARVRYHALLAVFGLLLATGEYSPVYRMFFRFFPLLGFIRFPVRFFFLFSFGAACLAGMGLARCISASKAGRDSVQRNAWGAAPVLVPAALLCAALLLLWGPAQSAIVQQMLSFVRQTIPGQEKIKLLGFTAAAFGMLAYLRRSLLFLTLLLSLLFLTKRSRVLQKVAFTLVPLIVMVDLAGVDLQSVAFAPAELLTRTSSNIKILLADREITRAMASPAQLTKIYGPAQGDVGEDFYHKRQMLAPGLAHYFKVHDVFGYDSLFVKWSDAIKPIVSQPPLMNLLNIKYIASPSDEIGPDFERVDYGIYANLFKNKKAMPRAFLVKTAAFEKDGQIIINHILSKDFDPEQRVWLDEPCIVPSPASGGNNAVQITEYSMNRVVMRAHSADRPWLFFSDTYYPGWKAFVDGRSVKIYKADTAFRALWLSPGDHNIVWRYDPWLFKVGAAVSLATLAGLVLLCVRAGLPGANKVGIS